MADYPSPPKEVIEKLDSILFVFDFDGTLVPQTKYSNDINNILQFTGFKLAINPSAFGIRWTIATSRPIQDSVLIEDCLRRNNAVPTYPVMAQHCKVPQVGNEAELSFKKRCIDYCKDNYHRDVMYIDNNVELTTKLVEKDPSIMCANIIDFLVCMRHKITEVSE
jgi:hypothetical protein